MNAWMAAGTAPSSSSSRSSCSRSRRSAMASTHGPASANATTDPGWSADNDSSAGERPRSPRGRFVSGVRQGPGERGAGQPFSALQGSLLRPLPCLIRGQRLGRVDITEGRVLGHHLVHPGRATPRRFAEDRDDALRLHLADARQRQQATLEIRSVSCLGPDPARIVAVVARRSPRTVAGPSRPSIPGIGGAPGARGRRRRGSRDRSPRSWRRPDGPACASAPRGR